MIKAIGFLGQQVGDLVMCSVAVRQFKKQYPVSHLTFSISQKYGHVNKLFEGLAGVDAVHIWQGDGRWPTKEDISFLEEGKFDIAFNAFPEHTHPAWYNHLHYIEETCLMLGLQKPTNLQCSLGYVPKKLPNLDKTITLSLFASGNQLKKTIRPDDMDKLVAAITEKYGYKCVQIGSSDAPIAGAYQAQASSIYDAIDILTSSRLHITIDTAFSWIASAYKHPTVGLYGITYPDMPQTRIVSHNPVNPNAIYINKPSVKDVEVEEILLAIDSIIG